MFIVTLCISLALLGHSLNGFGQKDSLKYEISAGWINLGIMNLKWDQQNDTLKVVAISQVEIPLLFTKRRMRYKTDLTVVSGVLESSRVNVWVNEELKEYCYTKKEGNTYRVHKKTEDENEVVSLINKAAIRLTTTLLLFNKPNSNEEVYAELHANLGKISKLEEKKFVLINSETGKETEYFYENDILKSSVMSNRIMDFELNRMQP